MSYQVLARKWRPKSFEELMGQEHVVTVLVNALEQQRIHHAYLFTGTRGVGKTTIARIFAKSLNCDLGVSSNPCGQCDTCQDIDEGRFVDLLEIDAASRTKVDDTREILDNVQYAPTRGRYKVYLIDEVHMLSRSSFNALLKTLEEPPEHVKFILATTDPQKLPVTVLSRCLQFHLKALAIPQIKKQLAIILEAEDVSVDETSLTLLAKAARGSMRDSLSLTDQAIAQGRGTISSQSVQQMLGGVDHHWVFKILILLIKQDSQGLMNLSLEIASYAPNYGRLMAELIQLLHQIAMAQVVDTHFELSSEHNQLMDKFCQSMSPEDVQLYYQIVLNGRKDLPYAADEQAAFDMTLLRLLSFRPKNVTDVDIQTTVAVQSNIVNFDDVELASNQSSSLPEAVNVAQEPIGVAEAKNEDENNAQIQALAKEQDELEQLAHREFHKDVTESDTAIEKSLRHPSPLVPSESAGIINESPHTEPEVKAEPISPPDNNTVGEDKQSAPLSSIETIIANRNMLRSRKKALEKDEKKSDDAEKRQTIAQSPAIQAAKSDVPDISTISEQPYSAEVIDPSVIKKANQVDKWANMIDSMLLNGRLRVLAQRATISEQSNEDTLVLELDQSTKHLKTDVAHEQLQAFVSEYFEKPMAVEIVVVEQTQDDPYQIQEQINDKRYDYAKELLLKDDIVIALQNEFQAEIDENTVIAR